MDEQLRSRDAEIDSLKLILVDMESSRDAIIQKMLEMAKENGRLRGTIDVLRMRIKEYLDHNQPVTRDTLMLWMEIAKEVDDAC